MLEQKKSELYAAEAEEGMEMIQVAFSIAIAVCLGLIVMNLVNGVIAPGMQDVADSSTEIFDTLTGTVLTPKEPGTI